MKALKGWNEDDCSGERCSAGDENTCENKEEQQDANSTEEQAETDDAAIAENANDTFQSQEPQENITPVCLSMMLASIWKNLSISRCYKADSEGSSIDSGAKGLNSLCPAWIILSGQTFLSVVFPVTVEVLSDESESDEIWPMRSQRLREESFNGPRARRELRGKSPISLAENGFYWDAESEIIQCFYCRCRPFDHVDCQRERCNVTSQMSFRPMLRVDELGMMGVAEHVPGPVLPQGSRASRGGPSNDVTGATSCSSQTDRLESPRLPMHAESREHHGAIADSGLYDGLGATASLSGATAAERTSSPSASPSGRSNDQAEAWGDNVLTEDRESLARLEVQNRALSQQLRCRVCHQAAIDTILMPCRHLVVCETCTRSMTSCPLCQDTIRAVVRVHVE